MTEHFDISFRRFYINGSVETRCLLYSLYVEFELDKYETRIECQSALNGVKPTVDG
jgi:hypothetical protein